ncbi:MAG: hypothetical protein JXA00_00470 [Candidatus Thermoplasmatota archaeon]|nr:hypothetical protein [Candidatus Thermoplasmatota archaeon]
MNKKILIGCIGSVVLLILVSYTSVVGFQTADSGDTCMQSSPLFATQTLRSINKKATEIQSYYLGKGEQLNIFPSQTSLNDDMVTKARKLFSRNPALFNRVCDNLGKLLYFRGLLNKYSISIVDVKNYLRMIIDEPSLFTEEMKNIQIAASPDDTPQPLGLSTSSPLGYFIVGLVVLPIITVVVTLVSLLFTLRIFTCLNVNDCANDIAKGIWDQLVQELTPA